MTPPQCRRLRKRKSLGRTIGCFPSKPSHSLENIFLPQIVHSKQCAIHSRVVCQTGNIELHPLSRDSQNFGKQDKRFIDKEKKKYKRSSKTSSARSDVSFFSLVLDSCGFMEFCPNHRDRDLTRNSRIAQPHERG